MYQIFKSNAEEKGVEATDESGELLLFPTASVAKAEAKRLQELHGDWKFFIKKINTDDDENWADREQHRLNSGQYRMLPYWFPVKPEHYCHISDDPKARIAFTPDENYGRRGVTINMAPGKYLFRYFPNTSPDDRRDYATALLAEINPVEILFATDPDDILSIYLNGPRSCMSHDHDYYPQNFHPAQVYGNSPDLAIAYIKRDPIGDDDIDDRPLESSDRYSGTGGITARAVVWPDKKLYGRVYGDETRLRKALENLGYTQSVENFTGARIKVIDADAPCTRRRYNNRGDDPRSMRYRVPYLDLRPQRLRFIESETGPWLQVDPKGPIVASYESGVTEYDGHHCASCDDHYAPNYFVIAWKDSVSRDYCCTPCKENGAVWYSEPEAEFYFNSVPHVEVDGEKYSTIHVGNHLAWCENQNRTVRNMLGFIRIGSNQLGFVRNITMTDSDGNDVECTIPIVWSHDFYEEHGFRCPITGHHLPKHFGIKLDANLDGLDLSQHRMYSVTGLISRMSDHREILLTNLSRQMSYQRRAEAELKLLQKCWDEVNANAVADNTSLVIDAELMESVSKRTASDLMDRFSLTNDDLEHFVGTVENNSDSDLTDFMRTVFARV